MFDHLKYLLCFFLPVTAVCFLSTEPHSATAALLWTTPVWLLIIADWFSPKINPLREKTVTSSSFYATVLYVLTLLQFLIIGLLLLHASQLPWDTPNAIFTSAVNLLAMRILVGTTSGSSALIVAHELIHRPIRHQRILGRMLLYTVCYEHFVIAHIRGHHFSVATPTDIATAHMGESFSAYWKRVYPGHFNYAWHSELQRLSLTQFSGFHYKMLSNSVLQGVIVEIILILMILSLFGWAATFIFLYQAFSGVRLLETINYYQHWGLEQGKTGNTLAWVNQSSVTEYALIGLSQHIAHHQNSATAFQEIPYSDQGPVMPYGYFVSNLWVKLNNESYRSVSANLLKKYLLSCKDQ